MGICPVAGQVLKRGCANGPGAAPRHFPFHGLPQFRLVRKVPFGYWASSVVLSCLQIL